MYRRAGLIALSVFGAANAQNNKCWECESLTPITDLTNSNGQCYFTSTLDENDAAKFVDCDGSCYVKYTSEDGILQTVKRGCLTAGTTDTSTLTDFDFLDGAADVAALTNPDQKCEIEWATTTHLSGNSFTANAEENQLTKMTCSKICPANSETVACNGGSNYEVETLSDCGGFCVDTNVCTCDHWTGEITNKCARTTNAILLASDFSFTERLVNNNGAYECEAYDCQKTCSNTDATDATLEIAVAGATCLGNGALNSQGTCRCDNPGTTTAIVNKLTGGQFLDTSDAAAFSCENVVCSTACSGTGQQCQHDLFGSTGTCACSTIGQVQNSDNTACEPPETVNRKCQQCSSDLETGNDCANGAVTASECTTSSSKCAAVSTLWVNSKGESIREVVERGCSEDLVVKDTCEFQTISSVALSTQQSSEFNVDTVTEVTCRYVCDEDNCNNEVADGQDDAEPAKRMCYVGKICEGVDSCKAISDFTTHVEGALADDGSSNFVSTACDNIDNEPAFCVAHMNYLEHQRYDGVYERSLSMLEFKCQKSDDDDTKDLTETDQSCSTATITVGQQNFITAAKTDKLGAVRQVINMHSCMTVCDSNNCNNAWPGQPTCYTCNSADTNADGSLKSATDPNHCFTNVEMPAACANYYDNACFIKQSGLDLTSNWAQKSMNPYSAMQSMGAYKAISRGCDIASAALFTEGEIVDNGDIMTRESSQNQHAYNDRMVTCNQNGCNFGPALPTPEN